MSGNVQVDRSGCLEVAVRSCADVAAGVGHLDALDDEHSAPRVSRGPTLRQVTAILGPDDVGNSAILRKGKRMKHVWRLRDNFRPYGDFVHSVALELNGLTDRDDLDLGLDDRDLDGRYVPGVVGGSRRTRWSGWPLTSRNWKMQHNMLST